MTATGALLFFTPLAMNDNVYARVRDKVKEANLTQEEIAAIDKARNQLNNYGNEHSLSRQRCRWLPCIITDILRNRILLIPTATFGGFVGTTFALVLGKHLPESHRGSN